MLQFSLKIVTNFLFSGRCFKNKVKQKTLTFCWCQVWKVIWVIGLVAQTRSDIDIDDHNGDINGT